MIIKSIQEFISKCPCLDELGEVINVDYLSEDSTSYAIEEVPSNPIIKKYINGDSLRQYDFIFTSRESYGADVFQNIENSSFYESFASWIEKSNNNKDFPILEADKKAVKIEVTSTGYAFQTQVDKARYQIQCKLIYFQGVI